MTRALVLLALAATAACSTARLSRKPAAEPAPPRALDVRDVGGAWRADPRWSSRVREIDAAAPAALERIRAETGIAFNPGHGPIVEFDSAAPASGDASPRFVDGVRRPVVRIAPAPLLRGEFVVPQDLATLLARSASLSAAGERTPPAWTIDGASLVVAGSFDLELHRRALGGPAPRVREDELLGAATSADPLGAAARAKALLRCAQSQRPFVRLFAALASGKSEDAALAEVGIPRRDFLDAATETDRARAVAAVADDPLLPSLREARVDLLRGDVDRADAALARFAASPADVADDPWLAADARLCLAQIAMARGEEKNAKASLDAAEQSSMVVRVRDARIVETWLAVKRGAAGDVWSALVRDFPDLTQERTLALLGVAADVAAKFPGIAADAASLDAGRRGAAAKRIEQSGAKELAPLARLLAAPSALAPQQAKPSR